MYIVLVIGYFVCAGITAHLVEWFDGDTSTKTLDRAALGAIGIAWPIWLLMGIMAGVGWLIYYSFSVPRRVYNAVEWPKR